ncbi:MAG: OmpA family protein [Bacteroidota bacterium]
MKIPFTILCVFLSLLLKAQNAIYILNEREVSFKSGCVDLSDKAKKALDTLSIQLISNPDYKLKVSVYCTRGPIEYCYERVSAILLYLVNDKGLDTSRCRVDWKADVDLNTVRLNMIKANAKATCEIKEEKIGFAKDRVSLSLDQEKALAEIASYIRTNSQCHLIINWPYSENEKAWSLSINRARCIKDYLIKNQGLFKNNIVLVSKKNSNPNFITLNTILETP